MQQLDLIVINNKYRVVKQILKKFNSCQQLLNKNNYN